MAQVSKYRYLLNQYPETVQKEQFRIICHISKRTARYLLQSGLVPCVQSGKKTRNYTIMLMQAVRGELTVGTIRYSIFEGRPHISMIEVLEDYRRQGIATQMLRYLQGQYPNEEIVWGYLTEDGSALYQAVVDEQPNPDYLLSLIHI